MKIGNKILIFLLLVVCQNGHAQNFINLGFESASLVPAGGFYVQFNQAFPGWIGTVGGVQQTLALTNNFYLDTSGISIIDRNYNNDGIIPGGLIQGRYTALLQAGLSGPPADTSLSQTGIVPANAQSLQFEAFQATDGSTAISPFAVTLGGQTLSLIPLSYDSNYTLYGADISSWAGKTAQLSFTMFAENPHVDDQYLYLDAIQFSTQPVPEPSGLALIAAGGLMFGFRRSLRDYTTKPPRFPRAAL